jgi:hypothetical protein
MEFKIAKRRICGKWVDSGVKKISLLLLSNYKTLKTHFTL